MRFVYSGGRRWFGRTAKEVAAIATWHTCSHRMHRAITLKCITCLYDYSPTEHW